MIFCVEDDNSIRSLEIYALQGAGLTACGFSDAKSLWQALDTQMPELILLDIMLPDEDGLSILRALRSREDTRALPVMMASAKGAEYDKVLGLDSGADDYIAKPFGMMELVSRVKALLRRARTEREAMPDTGVLCVGAITLHAAQHRVAANGQEVALTRKEFSMLEILLQKPGKVLSRDAMLTQVWGYGFDGETRTVDVHMRTLRNKLGKAGAQIETVRGVGYRIGTQPEQE